MSRSKDLLNPSVTLVIPSIKTQKTTDTKHMDLSFIPRRPKLFFVLSLLLALGLGSFAPQVQTVNNVDYFTLDNDPTQIFYEQFQEVFGHDEFFVIAFTKDNLFQEDNLGLLKSLTHDLDSLQEVRETLSLANADHVRGGESYFEVREFLENIPSSKQGLDQLRSEALNNPLYAKTLVSEDGRTAAIVVFPYDRPENADYRAELLSQVDDILKRYQGTEFHVAGWTVTNLLLSQYVKQDMARFIPLTYVLILVVVWLLFRNLWLVGLAFVNISACLASTMGFFFLSGITLNNVTTIVPPLVMALSLADTVHIYAHLRQDVFARAGSVVEGISLVLNKVALPCLLTSVTTAVGFLSLSVSDLPPVREFAWTASAGMIFEFFFAFFLLAPLLVFLPREKILVRTKKDQGLQKALETLNRTVQSRTKTILACSVVLIAGSLLCAAQVKVDTNLIEFFKEESQLRRDLDIIEKRLSGTASMDISFKADHVDAFKDPEHLRVIAQVARSVQVLPEVDVTLSVNDFLRDINQAFHAEDRDYYRIPDSRQLVAQYLLLYDSDDIEDFISRQYDHARLAIRMNDHSMQKQAEFIERIRSTLEQIDSQGLDMTITGRAPSDVRTAEALVESQIKSLAIAGGVIMLLMFLILRSMRIGALSLVSNGFPILLNFGFMGLLGIPLNTATALISAVALGIAVDDSIHFLSSYAQVRREGHSRTSAVGLSILEKGPAITASSIILCIGFGVMIFSHFVPMIHFGLLSAIIMVTACIGDLVVLPALILAPGSQVSEPSSQAGDEHGH